jgi:hypothetical protein
MRIADNGEQMHEAQEVSCYLLYLATFHTIVIWGTLPFFSIKNALSQHARRCIGTIYGILLMASSIFSFRITLIMQTSWLRISYTDMPYLAGHCRVLAVFPAVVTLSGLLSTFACFLCFYILELRLHSTVRRMLQGTKGVIEHFGLIVSSCDQFENKKEQISEFE